MAVRRRQLLMLLLCLLVLLVLLVLLWLMMMLLLLLVQLLLYRWIVLGLVGRRRLRIGLRARRLGLEIVWLLVLLLVAGRTCAASAERRW